ncbi:MAG: thiopurine S-methyltransferase [Gammaproteobacteria bacterium]|jgi:thiopurine S-methyltransferase|nr:thiopurine S-methyltransferase [Gammaproteobacteria bacterium]
MDATFWQQRWADNAIGFHLDDVNPNLVEHFNVLGVPVGGCVFVPLCGKSQDLLWLAQQGINVIGVELSEKAVAVFFSENQLTPTVKQFDHLERWQCDNITIYRGDFFSLIPELLEGVDAVYDRAALVALPKAMRSDYCRHLNYIVPEPLTALLVSFDYDQEKMDGPPFSVPAYEVRYHFGDVVPITPLSSNNIITEVPHFAKRGLDTIDEQVYFLGYPTR